MAHLSKYIKDRKLEDRAFLEFFYKKKQSRQVVFPADEGYAPYSYERTTDFSIVKIPFFENPTISESKTSRLGKYKIIGRNSDLYSYLGSDSRSVNLSFMMTLPNLYEYSQLNLTQYKKTGFMSYERDPEAEKLRFKELADLFPPTDNFSSDKFQSLVDTIQKYEQSLLNSLQTTTGVETLTLLGETLRDLRENPVLNLFSLSSDRTNAQKIEQTKVKALYYFWINVIRTSTMGSLKASEGPPIIKLTFGPMYQRVPFIATKYDISIDESAGYDKLTLLPHRIKINLSLEEFRVGNFGNYSPISDDSDGYVSIENSENVAGWEAVLNHGSTDPRSVPPGFTEDVEQLP